MSGSNLRLPMETEGEARIRLAAHCEYQAETHDVMARAFPRQAQYHRDNAEKYRSRAASLRANAKGGK